MLTQTQRWILIRNFGVLPAKHLEFLTLLDAIEANANQAGLVEQLQVLLVNLAIVEASLLKLGTKEAGVTQAGVLAFNDRDRLYFTQGRRDEILAQISCLIGWSWSIQILTF